MNRESAKDYILDHPELYFTRDKSGKGYICPVCHSGAGRHGTGITTKDGRHFTCWRGCFTNADIFQIIGQERGITGYDEQFKEACNLFNITLDTYPLKEAPKETKERPKAETNYTSLYTQAHLHIHDTDYPQRRGLRQAVIDRFNLGFIEEWRHPKAPATAPATPRLIIPVSEYNYLARDTRQTIPEEQQEYAKSKVKGKEYVNWIFNKDALDTATQPIFILEGEIDALSVIEVGGEAIALGSVAYKQSLVDTIKAHKPKQPLLIALDNDEAGQTTTRFIQGELSKLGIKHQVVNVAGEYKDANEALQKDRITFTQAVEKARADIAEQRDGDLDTKAEALNRSTALTALQKLKSKAESGKAPAIISTGFSKLDEVLNGGFRAGLYTLGAISALGKTSLILQLADNIAKQGKPVLFVSLEMDSEELIAKILSRITYEKSMRKYGSFNTAKTTVGIQNTHNYKHYEQDAQEIIAEAIADFETRAGDLFILEGVGNIRIADIQAKIEDIKEIRGQVPVVFIDYLQIISAGVQYKTDKQAIDEAVLTLKRLSRDEETPVICISSFNRDNYTEPVNLASFKESGAIEYTSDVLLGMQYKGMDYKTLEKDADRKARVKNILDTASANGSRGKGQAIELKVLKNRNGNRGVIDLEFVPMFNSFKPADTDENEYKTLSSWQ